MELTFSANARKELETYAEEEGTTALGMASLYVDIGRSIYQYFRNDDGYDAIALDHQEINIALRRVRKQHPRS